MEETIITFDQLPMVTQQLRDEVRELKNLVLALATTKADAEPKQWLNLADLIAYLPDHPSKATVYGWVCNRQIPYYKVGRRLSFLQSEIDEWINGTYKQTAEQMHQEVMESKGYRKGGIL